jgi:membrane-bound metal-dependent hydrolase YbcI (DUF457 family)
MLPDFDNIAVAAATRIGEPTTGLHRTFTHSIFFVISVIILFGIVGRVSKQSKWENLGLVLGVGVSMHILLDLLIWFNGVEILWPIPSWVNFWSSVGVPEWFSNLMMPFEHIFFAATFITLGSIARNNGKNLDFLPKLRLWTWIQVGLFIVFYFQFSPWKRVFW